MTWSLVTLKDTSIQRLPPGPGDVLGAHEGSLSLRGRHMRGAHITKAKTGSGLPMAAGGILGGAEGIAYLVALGGVVVGVMQVTHFDLSQTPSPLEGGPCFSP